NGSGVTIKTGDVAILGDKIGTNLTGNIALPNAQNGVLIQGGGVVVGGTVAGARNVISGNAADGILVQNVTRGGVNIQGTSVGTWAAGTATRLHQAVGVALRGSSGVTVGGTVAGAGNVISGNNGAGVSATGGSNILVAGNLVGTDATGTVSVAN